MALSRGLEGRCSAQARQHAAVLHKRMASSAAFAAPHAPLLRRPCCAVRAVEDEAVQSAAASVTAAVDAASQVAANDDGILSPITATLDAVLRFFQTNLEALHVPYTYGYSIIALVCAVKLVTYPLTKKQVESALAMQNLKPRIDAIKERYGDAKDKVQRETSLLYAKAGVDPLAGCGPTLLSLPIYFGLYRSLSNVANTGELDAEGFYWIPSLAGPVSLAAREQGSGISWLWPLIDGAPPTGWENAAPYLVLPVLLVVAQYVSTSILSPPVDPNDENAKVTKALLNVLPLFIGWVGLNVPSGLQLYYFTNSVLTSAQQYWLRNLGGAQVSTPDLGPVTKLGMGRRMGPSAAQDVQRARAMLEEAAAAAAAAAEQQRQLQQAAMQRLQGGAAPATSNGNGAAAPMPAAASNGATTTSSSSSSSAATVAEAEATVSATTAAEPVLAATAATNNGADATTTALNRRCKRKRRQPLVIPEPPVVVEAEADSTAATDTQPSASQQPVAAAAAAP